MEEFMVGEKGTAGRSADGLDGEALCEVVAEPRREGVDGEGAAEEIGITFTEPLHTERGADGDYDNKRPVP